MIRLALVGTLVTSFLVAGPLVAEKTDIVEFINGDRLTGEVKGLERGQLSFKTDATGTIQIEWDDVTAIASTQTLEVENDSGERLWGSLQEGKKGQLIVLTEEGPRTLELDTVVYLTPIERSFWKRLDGSLDLGFSFSEADDRTEFSFGSETSFRSPRLWRTLSFHTAQTSQPGTEGTDRSDLEVELVRPLRKPRRIWFAFGKLEQNNQLSLDLRTLVSGAAGWFVVQGNSNLLLLSSGLAFSREDLTTDEPDEENIEAFLGLGYQNFRYDSPERDIDIRLRLFPSLSQSGRIRAELDASIRWEIVSDLYFGLTLTERVDSDPSSLDAEKTDLSLTTSIGWSF